MWVEFIRFYSCGDGSNLTLKADKHPRAVDQDKSENPTSLQKSLLKQQPQESNYFLLCLRAVYIWRIIKHPHNKQVLRVLPTVQKLVNHYLI